MSDLWVTASGDHEAQASNQRMVQARVAVAGLWPVLASALSTADLDNRLALHDGQIEAAVKEVAGLDLVAAYALKDALVASLREDWKTVRTAAGRRLTCGRCNHTWESRAQYRIQCPECGAEESVRQAAKTAAEEDSCSGAGKQVGLTSDNKSSGNIDCPVCGRSLPVGTDGGNTVVPKHKAASKTANGDAPSKSGGQCAVCGDFIEKDPAGENPSTWHHDNGEKHDHEAKPRRANASKTASAPDGTKATCGTCGKAIESMDYAWYHLSSDFPNGEDHNAHPSPHKESRKTATKYCKTHNVYIGEGNRANHDEACKIEDKATAESSRTAANPVNVADWTDADWEMHRMQEEAGDPDIPSCANCGAKTYDLMASLEYAPGKDICFGCAKREDRMLEERHGSIKPWPRTAAPESTTNDGTSSAEVKAKDDANTETESHPSEGNQEGGDHSGPKDECPLCTKDGSEDASPDGKLDPASDNEVKQSSLNKQGGYRVQMVGPDGESAGMRPEVYTTMEIAIDAGKLRGGPFKIWSEFADSQIPSQSPAQLVYESEPAFAAAASLTKAALFLAEARRVEAAGDNPFTDANPYQRGPDNPIMPPASPTDVNHDPEGPNALDDLASSPHTDPATTKPRGGTGNGVTQGFAFKR